MIVVAAICMAYGLGVEPIRLVVLGFAVFAPVPVGVLVLAMAWTARRREDDRAALFCEGVASELRAGATLRDALVVAASSTAGPTVPALPEMAPVPELAASIAGRFTGVDEELRLTIVNASTAGSDSAALFDEIGSVAMAQAEIRREVAIATAPAQATAAILIGAPVIFVLARLQSGQIGELVRSSEQRTAALIGLLVFGAGLVIASIVLWRAGR